MSQRDRNAARIESVQNLIITNGISNNDKSF